MNKQIIIARYNEDISWIQQLTIPYLIYNKGDELPEDITHIDVPNEYEPGLCGREVKTYLDHIIDNYDNLYDCTIFVQGHPFDHADVDFIDKVNNGDFGDFEWISNAYHVENLYGQPDLYYPHFASLYGDIFGCIVDFDRFEFYAGAQFAVSKSLIQSKPKDFYQHVWGTMHMYRITVDKNHPSVFSGRDCSQAIAERIWEKIFK